MTKQETFDIVVSALLKQGRPSMDNVDCRYRAADGAKCAAGHLIPDEKYDPVIEGAACFMHNPPPTPKGDRVIRVMTILREEGHDPNFVRDLQGAHDDAARRHRMFKYDFVKEFRVLAVQIASDYSLSMDKINQEFPL